MQHGATITIRPLRPGDGAFLCSIFKDNADYYNIFYDSETSVYAWEQRVLRFIQQKQICHRIIEADNSAIGWLSFSDLSQTERELDILVLKKDHLGQGYGASTLSWFLKLCKDDHINSVFLNVNQANIRALRFYQAFGFRILAEEIVPQCNDAQNLAQYRMGLQFL